MFEMRHMPKWLSLFLFPKMGPVYIDLLLSTPELQQLLNSNEKFDLVLGEVFLSESLLGGLSAKFQASLIGLAPFMANGWVNFWVKSFLILFQTFREINIKNMIFQGRKSFAGILRSGTSLGFFYENDFSPTGRKHALRIGGRYFVSVFLLERTRQSHEKTFRGSPPAFGKHNQKHVSGTR